MLSDITFFTPRSSLSRTRISTNSIGSRVEGTRSPQNRNSLSIYKSQTFRTLLDDLESRGHDEKTATFRRLLNRVIDQNFNNIEFNITDDMTIEPFYPDEALLDLLSSDRSFIAPRLCRIAVGFAISHRFADAENVLERVPPIAKAKAKEHGYGQPWLFHQLTPCSRLLFNIYLIQGKFWCGEVLIQSRLAHAVSVFGAQSKEAFDLQILLLIIHTDGLTLDDEGEALIVSMVDHIEAANCEIGTKLLILELLRSRYYSSGEHEKELSVLQRTGGFLNKEFQKNLMHISRFPYVVALALSYINLKLYEEADWWISMTGWLKNLWGNVRNGSDIVKRTDLMRQQGLTVQQRGLVKCAYLEDEMTEHHPSLRILSQYLHDSFL